MSGSVPWWRRETTLSAEARVLVATAIIVACFLAGLLVGSLLEPVG